MPDAVEAIYYTSGLAADKVSNVVSTHAAWLARYPQLAAADNPLVVLDRSAWDAPFRAHGWGIGRR